MSFKDHYPKYREVERDGVTYYLVEMAVGGRDDDGEFFLVLDGPAQGERAYL